MNKPTSEKSPASTPDQMLNSGKGVTVELSEQELNGVSAGGATSVQNVTLNKAKTANKAYTQMDGYIKQ